MRLALVIVLVLTSWVPAVASPVHFESPSVHPLELSADRMWLYAAHTADHRLVVYHLGSGQVAVRTAEIPVGLEPVSVRARTPEEVWVVNHISDSISIVDLATGHVVRTLVVGDEPTDVVFAGTPERAFVCVSQEDRLLVFDPSNLDAAPIPVELQMSDPRSLATDGTRVFVTALEGGNRTTAIPEAVVTAAGGPPAPNPPLKAGLPAPPEVGLIVRYENGQWRDDAGGSWDAEVSYQVLDHDVAAVDVATLGVEYFGDVGTAMFNVAVAPTGEVVVTNQEASNEIRFEPNLKGRFVQSRLTRLDPSTGAVVPQHLNSHINYSVPGGDPSERSLSLSMPMDVVVSALGEAYVAAFGNAQVGVVDALGNVIRRIPVGDGPAGLALDETVWNRLFVLNRTSGTVSVVDLATDATVAEVSLGFDATPPDVREGRRIFYDAEDSSAHGDLSCASCHLFGGLDNLAWDLGDPTGDLTPPAPAGDPLGIIPDFHPMKGPMTTQSLKALSDTEPLHWRGDRSVMADFNPAFVGLLGRDAPLPMTDFGKFETFLSSILYPSNPFRTLDDALPPVLAGGNPSVGEADYNNGNLVAGNCVGCHTLPTGENGLIIPANLLAESEAKVVPQLRNMYEKTRFDAEAATTLRGFGYTHDGAVDDLVTFLEFPGFTFANEQQRRDVAAFLLCFDTGTHPAVGAQWTMDGSNESEGLSRLNTLQAVADLGAVDLIAKGRDGTGAARGWHYLGGGLWESDRATDATLSTAALLSAAGPGTETTFTGVLEGSGFRMGVDRDDDGFRDADERDAGSDPGDPASIPGVVVATPPVTREGPRLWLAGANPARVDTEFGLSSPYPGPARLEVFDLRGRRIRTLVDSSQPLEKTTRVGWDLRDRRGQRVPAGVYLVRLQTADGVRTERVAVLQR